jgi:hypothetical protein
MPKIGFKNTAPHVTQGTGPITGASMRLPVELP